MTMQSHGSPGPGRAGPAAWRLPRLLCAALALPLFAAAQQLPVGGDPAAGHALAVRMCAGCHGIDGNSTDPYFPKLAGQGAFYIVEQLRNFQQLGGRRDSGVMSAMAVDLQPQQMRDLAAWFSRQAPTPPLPVLVLDSRDAMQRGEHIYLRGVLEEKIPACASCHAVSAAGLPPEFPRLAGQHAPYLERQLRAFRAGRRASNPNRMMRVIAHKMSDADITAVANYIAALR